MRSPYQTIFALWQSDYPSLPGPEICSLELASPRLAFHCWNIRYVKYVWQYLAKFLLSRDCMQ